MFTFKNQFPYITLKSHKTKRIVTHGDMIAYLRIELAKIAGTIVMTYSQKLLGKKHYLWTTDKKYAEDLIKSQIKTHFLISKDLYPHIFSLLNFDKEEDEEITQFRSDYIKLHEEYVKTAPDSYHNTPLLKGEYLKTEKIPLSETAYEAGKTLFEFLPMANKLYRSNIEILYGQMRYTYINFLSELEKLTDTKLNSNAT